MDEEKAIILYSQGLIKPGTINEEAREVEVVFATETPVERAGWNEQYLEVLECTDEAVRRDYINNGLPVLDAHSCFSVFHQLGRTAKIWINEKRELCAVIRFSKREEANNVFNDILDGIITAVSVGYRVYKYEREERGENELPIYRAFDWLPFEISFLPVPADVNAGVRSADHSNKVLIITKTKNRRNMEEEILQYTVGDEAVSAGDTVTLPDGREGVALQDGEPGETIEVRVTEEEPDGGEGNDGAGGGSAGDGEGQRSAGGAGSTRTFINQNSGNARLNAILQSTRAAKLSDTFAIELFQSKKSIEQCRQAVINKLAAKTKSVDGAHRVSVGQEAIDKKRSAAQTIILHRVNPQMFKVDDTAREYRGMTLIELGKVLLLERGISVTGKDKAQIAQLLFSRAHSSHDFPVLFEGAIDKLLRAEYEFAPEFWDKIARQTSAADFREMGIYTVSGSGGMEEVAEGGEIKYTTLKEGKERLRLKSYGEGIRITRQAIINDDLSALEIIPRKFRRDWDTLRGDLVWGLITDNVTMGDGKDLFCAEHNNLLTGTGSALSETSLNNANVLLQRQKDNAGKNIRVTGKYLIVAPENEVKARKLLTATTPNSTEEVNVFANRFDLIVENRLTGKEWYLSTQPDALETLRYAYLEGNENLRVNEEQSFKTDTFDYAIRGDFGTSAVDFRGMVKATGK